MAEKLNNWNQESCTTIGSGPLVLSGVVSQNQTRFRDGFGSEDVYYSIVDGANREAGIGSFNGSDTITRINVQATLVNGSFNTLNPTPILLSGSSIVSGTFNSEAYTEIIGTLRSIDSRVISNTDAIALLSGNSLEPRVAQNETNIASNTALATESASDIVDINDEILAVSADVSYREVAITALEVGGVISQSGPTSVLLTAGGGEIIDSYTDTESQITKEISWGEQTVDLLAGGGMPVVTGLGYTYIGIESPGDSGVAEVHFYPNGLSYSQRRISIRLGFVEYIDREITNVSYEPIVSNQIGNTLMDLIKFVDTLSNGLVVRPTSIGDMSIWRSAGELFGVGNNFEVAKDNQNVKVIPDAGGESEGVQLNPLTYNNGTTVVGSLTLQVPSDVYEPDGSGSLAPIEANRSTIHYYMESTTGAKFMLYGQTSYTSHAIAVSNLFSDKSAHLFPVEMEGSVLLAQMVVDLGALTWGVGAEVFPIDSATSSGSSAGSATQAVNVSYSDSYGIGNNLQSSTDALAVLRLTPDQHGAVNAANAPTAQNPFAVHSDLNDTQLPQDQIDALNASDAPSGLNPFATTNDIPALAPGGGVGANLLINGSFEVFQRSPSGTFSPGDAKYDIDRWIGLLNSGTVTQDPIVALDGMGRSVTVSMGALTEYAHLRQAIEIEGGNFLEPSAMYALSFDAKSPNIGQIEIKIAISNEITDADALIPFVHVELVTISTIFNRYEVSFQLPSVIPTAATIAIVSFNNATEVANTEYSLRRVKLERGSVATEFEHELVVDNLAKCQRYYYKGQKISQATGYLYALANTTSIYGATIEFPVTMARVPDLEISGMSYAGCSFHESSANEVGASVSATKNGSNGSYSVSNGYYLADAEYY